MPITVVRLSDGASKTFDDISPSSWVRSLKSACRKDFLPKFPNGCRLKFGGKVMKSRHHLKHYKINESDTVEMDDRKNWSSSSSSSDSTD
jgi:hypothetical protein